VPAYEDAVALVAAGGVDAVVVATPVAAHLGDARAAAAAGLPTLVEKPPARDSGEARLLADLDPPPWIGFNRRFDPALLRPRPNGRLELRLTLHYRRASWRPLEVFDEALLDLGPHAVDLARWLARSPVRRVRTRSLTPQRCQLELELEAGRAVLSCATDRVFREVVEVRGSSVVRVTRGGVRAAVLARLRLAGEHVLVDSLVAELEAFCSAVRGRGDGTLATAADGAAAMAAVDAARRSAARGGAWVGI
jgi:myo-inositol 2-dehydrogenase/D-chiro-inositol 1-dehydrogenase